LVFIFLISYTAALLLELFSKKIAWCARSSAVKLFNSELKIILVSIWIDHMEIMIIMVPGLHVGVGLEDNAHTPEVCYITWAVHGFICLLSCVFRLFQCTDLGVKWLNQAELSCLTDLIA
jgi:hypothetical protein